MAEKWKVADKKNSSILQCALSIWPWNGRHSIHCGSRGRGGMRVARDGTQRVFQLREDTERPTNG